MVLTGLIRDEPKVLVISSECYFSLADNILFFVSLLRPAGRNNDTDRNYAVGPASLRQSGTPFSIVCGFSALRAEKPHTKRSERTMLPQAKVLRAKVLAV